MFGPPWYEDESFSDCVPGPRPGFVFTDCTGLGRVELGQGGLHPLSLLPTCFPPCPSFSLTPALLLLLHGLGTPLGPCLRLSSRSQCPVQWLVYRRCQINVSSVELQNSPLDLHFQVQASDGQRGCGSYLGIMSQCIEYPWPQRLARGPRQEQNGEDGCVSGGLLLQALPVLHRMMQFLCRSFLSFYIKGCKRFGCQLSSWRVSESDGRLRLSQYLPDSLGRASRWCSDGIFQCFMANTL